MDDHVDASSLQQEECEIAEKNRGGVAGSGAWEGMSSPRNGVRLPRETCLHFQVENPGLYAFLLRKTILVARNRDRGFNRATGD